MFGNLPAFVQALNYVPINAEYLITCMFPMTPVKTDMFI